MSGSDLDAFAQAMRASLELLTTPDIVVLVRRQHATSTWTATVGMAGDAAAVAIPRDTGDQHIVLFSASRALDRVAEWCGLAGNSVPGEGALTVTGTQLLAASERAAAGDASGAASALVGGTAGPSDAATRLAGALAMPPVAVHVSVFDMRGDARLEGTVTGWLDGGQWGLWRVPPSTGPEEPVELRLVSKAELLEEICEGLPDLRR